MTAVPTPIRPWIIELTALLKLGLPMALTQLVQFSIHTVDVVMIGRLGPEPLAASSVGMVLYYAMWLLAMGPAMAVSPLMSHALGADQDNRDDVRRSVRMGLWIVGLMFPAMIVFFSFTGELASALGQPDLIARMAEPYVLALAPGAPFALGVMILRNFLATVERTQIPLLIIALTTALNAFLNYLLIYGSWGAPELGLVGAGVASSLSHLAGFSALVLYVYREPVARRFNLFRQFLTPDWARAGEILQLGWPMGLATAFEALLFNASVFLMGRIGINEVAAFQVALNVAALAFMAPLGVSMAGCIRVGLAAGAQDRDRVRRSAVLTIGLSAATILAFAVPMLLAPIGIAGLYLDTARDSNAAVIGLIGLFLPIAGAFALFDATQVAANQCLRGLKDVRVPMILTAVSYWVVGFPLAAWLGLGTALGAVGVWWGLLAALASAAILLSLRLWQLTRVPAQSVIGTTA